MSKLLSRLAGIFSSRTLVGVDRTGNKYFTRQEPVDGIMKEKRWVTFKEEDDPTTIPVEWICWLNGQRKKAPTPEEMAEMEARRERVKLNVALLKKQQEEERKSKEGSTRQSMRTGKVGGPDLKSFIQQFPAGSVEGEEHEEVLMEDDTQRYRNAKETEERKPTQPRTKETPKSSEPSGSGQSFQPGTWQPPI